MGDRTRMTTLERSFFALERQGLPMHVAAILILDGEPLTLSELRRFVRSRLRRLPRFADMAVLDVLRSEWHPVAGVDLRRHVLQHTLQAPGSQRQLFELCAQLHAARLARNLPLWQIHLVHGLHGGRQALVFKTHHAITDGIGGIEIAESLFDALPAKRHEVRLAQTHFGRAGTSPQSAFLQGLFGLGFTAAGGPIAAPGPFNGRVGSERSFGATPIRMAVLRRLKRELGATVDDILLAVVAAGLRSYLIDIRYPQIPPALRAMVPVSTRANGRSFEPGNQVTAIFLDLPLDIDDVPSLVRRIAAAKATLRSAHAAAGDSMLVEAAGLLPNPLHAMVLGFVSALPFANVVLSDVPGPDEPLYVLGRRVRVCYPMMPLASAVGLSIAAIRLGGVMGIGVTADPGLVPDPQRIADSIELAMSELALRAGHGIAA